MPPELDAVAVTVESALIARGQLSLVLSFPYGSPAVNASDWSSPAKHLTELRGMSLRRHLDGTDYQVWRAPKPSRAWCRPTSANWTRARAPPA